MGQKSHPYSLKSSSKKSTWSSKYIEKISSDSSLLITQDLSIRRYLDRFFSIHGLILCHCHFHRTQQNITLYISYFSTKISSKLFKIRKRKKKKSIYGEETKPLKDQKHIDKILKKFVRRPRLFFNVRLNKRSNLIIKRKIYFHYKVLKKQLIIKKTNFISKLLSCLNLFLNKKYNIKIILKNINKGLSFRLCNKESFLFRKSLLKLRFYTQFDFFTESMNILLYTVKKKKSAKLLSEFIAFRFGILKKHNFFLTFIRRSLIILANSKYSSIKGIKIKITGRFNGAPRSKTRMFKINKLPVQTFQSSLDYSQSVSYTSNGTFGIKVWIAY